MRFTPISEEQKSELELRHRYEGDGRIRDRIKAVLLKSGSVSPVFEKPAGTSKSPAGTKTGDKYASGGPGRPGPP